MASRLTIGLILMSGFLCISCRFEVRELMAATPTPQDTKDHLIYQKKNMNPTELTESTLGLPDELKAVQPLWEVYQSATSNKAASISRLYEDGRLFSWSNTRRVVNHGKISRESAPYAWRLDAQVSPKGIKRLQELIRSEFVKLPTNSSATTGLDQGYVVYKSHFDGTDYRVKLPTSASINLPQVLRDLDYAIQSNIVPGAVPQTQ
jgi:hypothetical protein